MAALDEEYLTVTEAAALLRVAPSTIRRWIREGELPAYRLGRRRVGLRQNDLSRLVKPVRTDEAHGRAAAEGDELERIKRRKLTPEEIEQGLAALERIAQINTEILARRGGTPFPDSLDIIHEMRAERTRELTG